MIRLVFASLMVAVVLSGAVNGRADPPPAPRMLAPESWADGDLGIGYIGHASVLIKMSGTVILTDPAFENRIGVALGPLTIGPKRLIGPALTVEHLPPPAVVLVSHAHFDSLDLPSLRQLPRSSTLIGPG